MKNYVGIKLIRFAIEHELFGRARAWREKFGPWELDYWGQIEVAVTQKLEEMVLHGSILDIPSLLDIIYHREDGKYDLSLMRAEDVKAIYSGIMDLLESGDSWLTRVLTLAHYLNPINSTLDFYLHKDFDGVEIESAIAKAAYDLMKTNNVNRFSDALQAFILAGAHPKDIEYLLEKAYTDESGIQHLVALKAANISFDPNDRNKLDFFAQVAFDAYKKQDFTGVMDMIRDNRDYVAAFANKLLEEGREDYAISCYRQVFSMLKDEIESATNQEDVARLNALKTEAENRAGFLMETASRLIKGEKPQKAYELLDTMSDIEFEPHAREQIEGKYLEVISSSLSAGSVEDYARAYKIYKDNLNVGVGTFDVVKLLASQGRMHDIGKMLVMLGLDDDEKLGVWTFVLEEETPDTHTALASAYSLAEKLNKEETMKELMSKVRERIPKLAEKGWFIRDYHHSSVAYLSDLVGITPAEDELIKQKVESMADECAKIGDVLKGMEGWRLIGYSDYDIRTRKADIVSAGRSKYIEDALADGGLTRAEFEYVLEVDQLMLSRSLDLESIAEDKGLLPQLAMAHEIMDRPKTKQIIATRYSLNKG